MEYKMDEYKIKKISSMDLDELKNDVLRIKTTPDTFVKDIYWTKSVQERCNHKFNGTYTTYTVYIVFTKSDNTVESKIKKFELVGSKKGLLIKDLPVSKRLKYRIRWDHRDSGKYDLETFTVEDFLNGVNSGEMLNLYGMGPKTILEDLNRLEQLGYLKRKKEVA